MDNVTNKELTAIESLKEKLSDIYSTLDDFHRHDFSLLRFLRARDLNVEKAEDMFRKIKRFTERMYNIRLKGTLRKENSYNQIWRKENNVDSVMTEKVSEDICKRFPFKLCGFDEDGSYISVVPVGKYDYRQMVENKETKEFFRYLLKTNELAYELFKHKSTKDHYVTQAIVVMDYEGFSFRQLTSPETLQFMKESMGVLVNNYPEILKAAVIINAPKVFEIMYNLFKPMVSKATLAKVQIYGSDSNAWKEALWKLIPADQLPSQYGGANTTIPNYTFDMGLDAEATIVTLPAEDMETEIVPAGQKFITDIFISTPGTTLSWNFKTEHYDIGFYVTLDDEIQEIISIPRCDAHLHVQKGSLEAKQPGKYTLCFDNSYSKFRAKTLHYVTKTELP